MCFGTKPIRPKPIIVGWMWMILVLKYPSSINFDDPGTSVCAFLGLKRDLFNGDVRDLQRLGTKFGHGFAYIKPSLCMEAFEAGLNILKTIFQDIFYFHPWENDPIWLLYIFQPGLKLKPPSQFRRGLYTPIIRIPIIKGYKDYPQYIPITYDPYCIW